MRGIQAVRVCAAAAIVSAALVFVPGASAGITPLPLPGPAVAVSGNRAAVAWTADGVVQLATLQTDGTFSAGEGVGRTLDGRAPRLALTPAGDELLIWQSGGVLRSALRTAGHDTWTYETIASGVNDYSPPQLVIGSDGRATASWMGLGGALLVSTRSANGWGAPMLVAAATSQSSLAVDSAGDVALVFLSQGTSATAAGLWATLAAGANAWTAPVLISGSDVLPNGGYGLSVDGGGARTFVATWGISRPASAQNVQPLTRAARLRIPGTWEAPQDVVLPTLDPQLASTAFAGDWASGVDGLGNALAVVRFPTLAQGFALGATALASSGDAWTGPVTTDFPAERYSSDSAPSLAFADDGSATVAFLRSERDNFQMRIATSSAPFGTWLGQTVGMTFTGPDWSLDPVVAADSRVGAIALQSARGDLVAFARNAPGVAWTGPADAEVDRRHDGLSRRRPRQARRRADRRPLRAPALPGRRAPAGGPALRAAPARTCLVQLRRGRLQDPADLPAGLGARPHAPRAAPADALRAHGARGRRHERADPAHDQAARLGVQRSRVTRTCARLAIALAAVSGRRARTRMLSPGRTWSPSPRSPSAADTSWSPGPPAASSRRRRRIRTGASPAASQSGGPSAGRRPHWPSRRAETRCSCGARAPTCARRSGGPAVAAGSRRR